MPQVNFTLEDFRAVTKQEVQAEIKPVIERLDKLEVRFDMLEVRFDALEKRFDILEMRFDASEDRFDSFAAAVADDYQRIERRLIRIEADGKGLKRIVRKHAADIEELQTATGLR